MKRRLRQGAKLIVIDPRATGIVHSPHVHADYHLRLRPGTNVAVLNAIAHVIVTEGLTKNQYVADRCERESFEKWKAFVAEPRNSPEAVETITSVDAQQLRAAARLYATGGNGAIYYGLGVTEHSQGTTTVMCIANLATDDVDTETQQDPAIDDKVTNVVKLFRNLAGNITDETRNLQNEAERALKPPATGELQQMAKYMHGVGDSKNPVLRVLGGGLGAGVIARIVRGYTFISRYYDPGDSIHIVGFSRGAYTARALAGMIAEVGLLNRNAYDPNDKNKAYLMGLEAWVKCKGVVFTGKNDLATTLSKWVNSIGSVITRLTLKDKEFIPGVRLKSVG